MFMLNLQFDATRTDGIFEDNTPNSVPLVSSKMWISAADPNPWPSNFNPSNFTWTSDGPDNSLTLKRSQSPGNILIRVFGNNVPAGSTIRLTVVFGRKNRGSRVSSPFTLGGGQACTVFASDYDASAADGSWCWKLGPITVFPNTQSGSDKYEFVVGITVNGSNGAFLTFGHDPEMDVEN